MNKKPKKDLCKMLDHAEYDSILKEIEERYYEFFNTEDKHTKTKGQDNNDLPS